MPHSQPRRETRKIQVVDLDNDPAEEVFPISDLDCVMPKIYNPITSTYKLDADADREVVISNLCAGLQKTMAEYRFLAGSLHAEPKGKFYVGRSRDQATFTVHINHLEHTDFPSYSELEQREFPVSELNHPLLPPSFAPSPVAKDGEGVPVTLLQLNLIRGGLIIGAAIHHFCCDARGLDALVSRWAANTRSVTSGTPAPPFDPSCLDPTRLCSSTPIPQDQIRAAEARIRSLKYAPNTPQREADAAAMGACILHFTRSRLAALKAAGAPRDGARWVSTNDCVTALMWRSVLRARLARHGVAADDAGRRVRLMHSLDARDHIRPPVPAAYPGNSISFSCVERSVRDVLAAETFPDVAVAVRDAVNEYRSWGMLKDMMDYVAACPDRGGVQFNFDVVGGLDVVVTSWRVLTAYRTHDFGFGPLQALRWASPVLDGYNFYLPQRPKDDPEEGFEVFISLEKSCMERLLKDEELAKYARVRCV
ncbi:Transferase [Neofusicoccum parvum]|nr:Transferase [Neofusicoccum parvum]